MQSADAILGYRGDVVGPPADSKLPQYAADPRYRHFWLTDDKGAHHDCGPADPQHVNPQCGPMWDFRNASARAFYIADLLRENNRSLFDGIFVDTGDAVAMGGGLNLSVKSRQEIFNATALLWKELTVAANAAAGARPLFLVTPSLKDHLTYDPDGDDSHPLCNATTPMDVACAPYGEEVRHGHLLANVWSHRADGSVSPQAIYDVIGSETLWAPHRQFNIPSRDFGRDSAVTRTIIAEARAALVC